MTALPLRALLPALALALAFSSCEGSEPPVEEESTTGEESEDLPWSPGDAPIVDPHAAVHAKVATMLEITWTQTAATDLAWIEYTFENNEWHLSPPQPGTQGPHREVVLGVPADTEVTVRIVTQTGAYRTASTDYIKRTGSLPKSLPLPTVIEYYPALASSARYLLGSVDGSPAEGMPYDGPFWLYIIDRQGRIVWYYSDLGSNATIAFPRLAPDGTHIMVEKRMFGAGQYAPRVLELALDWSYQNEIFVPELDDCFDVTDTGSILYNTWARDGEAALRELTPSGQSRVIWNCKVWAQQHHVTAPHSCYSNTVNWNPIDDTVLLSMPYIDTVVEIDRQTGDLVGQWGDVGDSWDFEPGTWKFEFNHFANITPEGTLLVSSHMPGHEDTETPGDHAFMEFEIDRDNRRLVEKWVYHGAPDWAMYKGMAIRLENGNTLANYGTGGVIREITPDFRTAWQVKWDLPLPTDFRNRMVGHNLFVDDLYSLCEGPTR